MMEGCWRFEDNNILFQVYRNIVLLPDVAPISMYYRIILSAASCLWRDCVSWQLIHWSKSVDIQPVQSMTICAYWCDVIRGE